MEKSKVLERLADPDIPFLEKLRFAASLEMDLWENRTPPNLGVHEFEKLLGHISAATKVNWMPRKSKSGPHGLTGDDDIFKFEFLFRMMGQEIIYFVKGYFFDKGACRGVCIQSFREVRRKKYGLPAQ